MTGSSGDLAIGASRGTHSAYSVSLGLSVRNLLVKQLEIFKRVTFLLTHTHLVINLIMLTLIGRSVNTRYLCNPYAWKSIF
jgi:hypothetical protein